MGFVCFPEKEAIDSWWRSQLWILLVAQWIMFAPTIISCGIGEEVRRPLQLPLFTKV